MIDLGDCTKDGKYLGMPFNPVNYGEDNKIIRECRDCGVKKPQGKMQELSKGSQPGSGSEQLYSDGFFVCEKCWDKEHRFAHWEI